MKMQLRKCHCLLCYCRFNLNYVDLTSLLKWWNCYQVTLWSRDTQEETSLSSRIVFYSENISTCPKQFEARQTQEGIKANIPLTFFLAYIFVCIYFKHLLENRMWFVFKSRDLTDYNFFHDNRIRLTVILPMILLHFSSASPEITIRTLNFFCNCPGNKTHQLKLVNNKKATPWMLRLLILFC